MKDGPGEGENYNWNKIITEYSIEWGNGRSNNDSPGKIVYIPQNYLHDKSKDSAVIKDKIEPVLFKILPDFKVKYEQAKINIEMHNRKIIELVDDWFGLSNEINLLNEQLKNSGNKISVENEKDEIVIKIENLKEKNQLSDDELEQYKKITAEVLAFESRKNEISIELLQISDISEEKYFFNSINTTLIPILTNLPKMLQEEIKKYLEDKKKEILEEVNKRVIEYKKSVLEEQNKIEEEILKIKKIHKLLIEKYQKNIELEELVKKLNEYNNILKRIDDTETEIINTQDKLKKCETIINSEIDQRKSIIEELESMIKNVNQNAIEGIKFGMEYGIEEEIDNLMGKVNIRENSEFIDNGKLKINYIRKEVGKFLSAIYSGKPKVIKGYDQKEVAQATLSLTENILFCAEMEGDKIGGFSESTMTAGKRALFLLRLILAESEDTWPLLIDQPEDDLDSRSIYDEIVPFIKKKKKERQIIMVSHNANLVIGGDSEQVIVANRHGKDRKNDDDRQFNYLTGSLEYCKMLDKTCSDTLKSQGVREHCCDILDGGETAFEKRKNRYNIK